MYSFLIHNNILIFLRYLTPNYCQILSETSDREILVTNAIYGLVLYRSSVNHQPLHGEYKSYNKSDTNR